MLQFSIFKKKSTAREDLLFLRDIPLSQPVFRSTSFPIDISVFLQMWENTESSELSFRHDEKFRINSL